MKIKKGLVINKLGGVFVVYDNNTSTLHELNETAFFIILRLKKGKNKTAILKDLVDRFQISEGRAREDFDSFIVELKRKGLIEDKK